MRLERVNRGGDGYVAHLADGQGQTTCLAANTIESLRVGVLRLVYLDQNSMSQVHDIFTCLTACESACQRRRRLEFRAGQPNLRA